MNDLQFLMMDLGRTIFLNCKEVLSLYNLYDYIKNLFIYILIIIIITLINILFEFVKSLIPSIWNFIYIIFNMIKNLILDQFNKHVYYPLKRDLS
jgi:hypothetical protein